MDPLALDPLPVIEWANAIVLATAIACVVGALAFLTAGCFGQGENHV